MSKAKVRNILLGLVIVQLIIVLAFTGLLNMSSFRITYTNSLINSYAAVGQESVRNIEYAVKYGKPLDNFYGMEKILNEIQENTAGINDVRIIMPDGRIAYDIQGQLQEKPFDSLLSQEISNALLTERKSYTHIISQDKYHILLPIHDRYGEIVGALDMTFPEQLIDDKIAKPLQETLNYLFIIALFTVFLLAIVIYKLELVDEKGEINKKRFYTVIIGILLLAQITYAFINFDMFKKLYIETAQENTQMIAEIIQKNINSVIDKGVSYEHLYGLDEWLRSITEAIPEIDNIYINSAKDGKILYSANLEENMPLDRQDLLYQISLYDDAYSETDYYFQAFINIAIMEDYVKDKIFNIALDALTIFIISVLLMIEVTIFLMILLKRQIAKHKNILEVDLAKVSHTKKNVSNVDTEIVRPLAFIAFMAATMGMSFIPLMMKSLYEPILGLSEELILGLPISVEILTMTLAILLAGNIINKKGWRTTLLLGMGLLAIGSVCSALAWDGVSFILARAIVGIGYGSTFISMRSLAASNPEDSSALPEFNAGMFSGFNVGIIVGAMLADRVGFSQVFFIAAIVALVAIIFTLLFTSKVIRLFIINPSVAVDRLVEEESSNDYGFKEFFTQPKIIGFFLLMIIPIGICAMFIEYFFPVYGQSVGLSASNIGRGFLLHGLCIIFLGSFLSTQIKKHLNSIQALAVYGILTGVAVASFAIFGTIWAAFLAILILGTADSFGIVAENEYLLATPEAKQLGQDKALSYYATIRSGGQMLGPMSFGALAVLGLNGVALIGVTTIVFALGFYLWLVSSSKNHDKEINFYN